MLDASCAHTISTKDQLDLDVHSMLHWLKCSGLTNLALVLWPTLLTDDLATPSFGLKLMRKASESSATRRWVAVMVVGNVFGAAAPSDTQIECECVFFVSRFHDFVNIDINIAIYATCFFRKYITHRPLFIPMTKTMRYLGLCSDGKHVGN